MTLPRSLLVAGLLTGALLVDAWPACAARPAGDPLPGVLRRVEHFLRRHEVDGVTLDARYELNRTEVIRQTVVCQVLAYAELHEIERSKRLRREVLEHADFMLGRLDELRSHTPFDGMLAYALWSAWEVTGEDRFHAAALEVAAELRAMPTEELILNGGLMVAMATALEWKLTGLEEAKQKTQDIVAQLAWFENEDGSFPHWCQGTRDIHYTGWMGVELIHVASLLDDPSIGGYLSRMSAFLAARTGPDGAPVYDGPCPWSPTDCVIHYWSRASGCTIDYDTRGVTVEPAYTALLLDHAGSPKFAAVAGFLDGIEDGGVIADMFGYLPPPGDVYYPWSRADTSVINMSVIFWVLATNATDRARRGADVVLDLVEEPEEAAALTLGEDPPARVRDRETLPGVALTVGPNPARGACRLGFALAVPGRVRLAIVDVRGRRVRSLADRAFGDGAHALAWDGRDDAGRAAPPGAYVARLETPEGRAARRLVLL